MEMAQEWNSFRQRFDKFWKRFNSEAAPVSIGVIKAGNVGNRQPSSYLEKWLLFDVVIFFLQHGKMMGKRCGIMPVDSFYCYMFLEINRRTGNLALNESAEEATCWSHGCISLYYCFDSWFLLFPAIKLHRPGISVVFQGPTGSRERLDGLGSLGRASSQTSKGWERFSCW